MSDRREALGRLLGVGLAGAGVSAQAVASTQARPKAASSRRPARRLALVLGGGSARGFAHIGVIKALEAHGIKPDAIFGASAGALVGAFWAAGVSANAMETLAYLVRDDEIIDLVTGNAANRRGIVSGQALQNFVNQQLGGRSIESLPTIKGGRTMAYDEAKDRIYVVAAQTGPRPAPTEANPRPRPAILPDTFEVVVIGRK